MIDGVEVIAAADEARDLLALEEIVVAAFGLDRPAEQFTPILSFPIP